MLEFDAGNFASSQKKLCKKGVKFSVARIPFNTKMEIPSRSGEGELQSQGKGGATKVTSKELPFQAYDFPWRASLCF